VTSTPRVLVLDPSAESRLVLCELLGRSGVTCAGASRIGEGVILLSRLGVRVLVVDADAFERGELGPLVEAAARRGAATVVSGTNRPAGEITFVRKPYHYRELVHKIWAALEATETRGRAAA
jgi:DNA-binding response OmpR family regulator